MNVRTKFVLIITVGCLALVPLSVITLDAFNMPRDEQKPYFIGMISVYLLGIMVYVYFNVKDEPEYYNSATHSNLRVGHNG